MEVSVPLPQFWHQGSNPSCSIEGERSWGLSGKRYGRLCGRAQGKETLGEKNCQNFPGSSSVGGSLQPGSAAWLCFLHPLGQGHRTEATGHRPGSVILIEHGLTRMRPRPQLGAGGGGRGVGGGMETGVPLAPGAGDGAGGAPGGRLLSAWGADLGRGGRRGQHSGPLSSLRLSGAGAWAESVDRTMGVLRVQVNGHLDGERACGVLRFLWPGWGFDADPRLSTP